MNRLTEFEIGSGVKFSVIGENNEIINYRLCVISKPSWWPEDAKIKQFAFISDDNLYITDGCYSGGRTGFGLSNYNTKKITPEDKIEIITDDLDEIRKLIAIEVKANEEKEKERKEKDLAKMQKINSLPKTFETGIKEVDELYHFERTDVLLKPDGRITNSNIALVKKSEKFIHSLDAYKSKSGALQTKKFKDSYLFQEISAINQCLDAGKVLKALFEKRQEIQKLVY